MTAASTRFCATATTTANAFATISQTSVTNASALIAQMAAQNLQKADEKKMQEAFAALAATQKMVPKKNVLDPIILFPGRLDHRHKQQHHDAGRTERNTIR